MRETRYVRQLHHEPTVVTDFLADLRNDGKWRPEVLRTDLLSGTPGHVGATYRETLTWEGMCAPATLTVTEMVPGTRLVVLAEDPGYRAVYEYAFAPTADGTDMLLVATVETVGPVQLIEPFLWAMISRWFERDFDTLDAAIGDEVDRRAH